MRWGKCRCRCNRLMCEMYYRKSWNKRFVNFCRAWDEVMHIICVRCDKCDK